MLESGDRRVVVEGSTGIGKTTFVKKLCNEWAAQVLQENPQDGAANPYSQFKIIIPISLRHTRQGCENAELSDIMKHQFPFLTSLEIGAIEDILQKTPDRVCIILDGYEDYEIGKNRQIHDLSTGDLHPDTYCVLTTKPHRIRELKRCPSIVQQHASFSGFDDDCIRDFIKKFFEGKSDVGNKLKMYILYSNHPGILDLARIPCLLEAMCILWSVYQHLGADRWDIYELFIKFVMSITEEMGFLSEDKVMRINHPLLKPLGHLAYTWQTDGTLLRTFNKQLLEAALGENVQRILNTGLLYQINVGQWSFKHHSFQEFLIAYNLLNEEEPLDVFSERCSTLESLIECRTILGFICEKSPTKANFILQHAVSKVRKEEENDFFSELSSLKKFYKSPEEANLPTAHLTNWKKDSKATVDISVVKTAKLALDNITCLNVGQLLNSQIECIEIQIENSYPEDSEFVIRLQLLCSLLPKLDTLKSVTFDFKLCRTGDAVDQIAMLFSALCKEKIVHFKSKNSILVLYSLPEALAKMPLLETLEVSWESSEINLNPKSCHIEKLCEEINEKCPNLQSVILGSQNLTESFHCLSKLKKVSSLEADGCVISLESFEKYSTEAKRNLSKLETFCLKHTDMSPFQASLGPFVSNLPKLKKLSFDMCMIDGKAFESIAVCLQGKTESKLQALIINGGNLRGSGENIGKILHHLPHLSELVLKSSEVDPNDIKYMSNTIEQHKLTRMDLSGNTLSGSGDSLGKLLNKVQYLEHINLSGCHLTRKDIFQMNSNLSSQPNLQSLNMAQSRLFDGGLKEVSNLLSKFPNLQILILDESQCIFSKELVEVFNNMPPTLRELSLKDNTFGDKIEDILQVKKCIGQLEKLNMIGIQASKSTVDNILNALFRQNPKLQISVD